MAKANQKARSDRIPLQLYDIKRINSGGRRRGNNQDGNMKMLHCPTCKSPAYETIEIESESVHRHRKWNGEYYKVIHSNDKDIKSSIFCAKCKTKLV